MFKTISAALLAVSVLAAPTFAAGSDKATKAPAAKTEQAKPGVLNANAKADHSEKYSRHHRSHKKVSAVKTHTASKLAIKHPAPVAKRG